MDLQTRHVSRILREAMNPLAWDERVAVVRHLAERLSLQLGDDVELASPERYVEYLDQVVRSYVQSLDVVQGRFRSM